MLTDLLCIQNNNQKDSTQNWGLTLSSKDLSKTCSSTAHFKTPEILDITQSLTLETQLVQWSGYTGPSTSLLESKQERKKVHFSREYPRVPRAGVFLFLPEATGKHPGVFCISLWNSLRQVLQTCRVEILSPSMMTKVCFEKAIYFIALFNCEAAVQQILLIF